MFGLCMKGKKTKACCCVPLAVVGLSVSVILVILNAATFIDQLMAVYRSEKKQASQIVTVIFCALPLLCAFLSIFGILLKKSSLVGLAVSCIMPSIFLVIVAIITLWIGICQDDGDAEDSSSQYFVFMNWLKMDGGNKKYVRGAVATALGVIIIVLLCYVGDVYKSIANMLARQQNPWVISQKPKAKSTPLSTETETTV